MKLKWLPNAFSFRSAIVFACAATTFGPANLTAQGYFGQSFTAPSGTNTLLQSISVGQGGLTGYSFNNDTFTAEIFAVTGGGLSGPSLFSQVLGSSFDGFSLTPNINLTSGGTYALVVNVGQVSANTAGDIYADGNGIECGGTIVGCDVLFGSTPHTPADDLTGFSVRFGAATTTPEPTSFALIGTGLIGLVPVMRIRKR